MQLVLTEDQEFIAKTAEDFVAEKSPISRVRELRDSADATGFSRELWKEMADLGWAGIPFAEELGGADLGMAEFVTVLEALGRTLAPEPFLSTVLLAGQALRLGGSESQQKDTSENGFRIHEFTSCKTWHDLAYLPVGSRAKVDRPMLDS